MPKRKTTRGTGITVEQVTVVEPNAGQATIDNAEVERELAAHKAEWDRLVSEHGGEFAAYVRDIIAEAWEQIRDDQRRLNAGEAVDAEDPNGDHFPGRILAAVNFCRDAIKQNNADRAAWMAVQVGQLYERWKNKRKWERDALDGLHTQARRCEGGREGAKKRADEAAPRHARIRALVTELTPSEGFKGAKSLAAERLGVTVRTVERALSQKSTDTT